MSNIDKDGRNTEYLGRIVDIDHKLNRNAFGPGKDDHYTILTLADPDVESGVTVIKIPYNGWYAVDATAEARQIVEAGKERMRKSHLRAIGGKNAGRSGRISKSMVSYYKSGIVHLLESGEWVHEDDAIMMTAREYEEDRQVKRCAGCGKILAPGEAMSASLGISCPDCYDRLSDV